MPKLHRFRCDPDCLEDMGMSLYAVSSEDTEGVPLPQGKTYSVTYDADLIVLPAGTEMKQVQSTKFPEWTRHVICTTYDGYMCLSNPPILQQSEVRKQELDWSFTEPVRILIVF